MEEWLIDIERYKSNTADEQDSELIKYIEQYNKLIESDPDFRRVNDLALFATRLLLWTQMEALTIDGVDYQLTRLMHHNIQARAVELFEFYEEWRHFDEELRPWLAETARRQREEVKERVKRLKLFHEALKRSDIELPFHSVRSQFKTGKFEYGDILVLVGEAEIVSKVARYLSLCYQRTGGRSFLFCATDESVPTTVAQTIARLSKLAGRYFDVPGILKQHFMPIVKSPGLVVVEDLAKLVGPDVSPEDGNINPLLLFYQMQLNYKFGLICGIPEDANKFNMSEIRGMSIVVDVSRKDDIVVIGNDTMSYKDLLMEINL